QDTDTIQEAFISRLAADPNNPDELRDGALFLVGDPKQSIYRFRGAQPEIYFTAKQRMSAPERKNTIVYELKNNFRSNKDLIEWINKKFTEADSHMPIITGHRYVEMEPKKDIYQSANGSSKLIHGIYYTPDPDSFYEGEYDLKKQKDKKTIYVKENGPVYAEGSIEKDLEGVVGLIKNLTDPDNHYTITDYNEQYEPYERPIKYSDFLLMSAEKGFMEEYLNVLKEHDIPVRFDGMENLNYYKSLSVFVRLYGYLINPREPVRRMGAKEAVRELNIADTEEEYQIVVNRLMDFLYGKTKKMTAYGKAVFLESQLSVLLDNNNSNVNGGERKYSALELNDIRTMLRQMIEFVFSEVSSTGADILEGFEKYLSTGLEHELSLSPTNNAVRFMNLHKTKGLEGNIVILLDRRGKKKMPILDYRDGNTYYPADRKSFWSSVSKMEAIEKKYREEEMAEFHRLEYVAVTRAKQAFIFMGIISRNGLFATKQLNTNSSNTKHKVLEGFNTGVDYKIRDQKDISNVVTIKVQKPSQTVTAVEYDLDKDGYVNKSDKEKYRAAYESKGPSKYEKNASYIKEKAEEAAKQSGKTKDDERVSALPRPMGNILGNVLHRTMELSLARFVKSMSNGGDVEELVKKMSRISAAQAVSENEGDIIEISDNKEEYKRFVEQCSIAYLTWMKEGKRLDDIKEVLPEFPFSYYETSQNESESDVWMNGTADLIIRYKDGRVLLIDYKSDNDLLIDEEAMNQALEKAYKPQLDIYRKISRTMFECQESDVETMIISFSQKDEDGRVFSDESIRVRATAL
ncbi:MAG: UvrD-helicase domain-containing protein, partial [Lachnospiraceae bacterium]|nr:UvrD-helicase domain-containing protein [Lachnospiraceae bacterium]